MAYPTASAELIEFFRLHGYLVVEDVIDLDDLSELSEKCQEIVDHPELYALDWTWEKGKELADRDFKIIQAFPSGIWPEFMADDPFRKWAVEFASALMGDDIEFWYDQFLAKPPHHGAETRWHQDEGYWGPQFDDMGLTCWAPLQDVNEQNGCMCFIDGGHRLGILEHRRPDNVQADLLYCTPEDADSLARSCPIAKGSVTFHHSKTPHRTGANHTDGWRSALTQHLRIIGAEQGEDYPWRVRVEQSASHPVFEVTGGLADPQS